MNRRVELHGLLCDILDSTNAYFQPPSTLKMSYPCIVYSLSTIDIDYADNNMYRNKAKWMLKYISKDPEDPTPMRLLQLPLSSFDRFYTADNLNHSVINLYF